MHSDPQQQTSFRQRSASFMRMNFGLRTEIVVNIILLMGAALLFSGMLLLKITEGELIRQKETALREEVRLVGRLVTSKGMISGDETGLFIESLDEIKAESWFLTDKDLKIIASSALPGRQPERAPINLSKIHREDQVSTQFNSSWLLRQAINDNHTIVTIPLIRTNEYQGSLQVRFSLEQIDQQLADSWRIALLYVALYGGVLFLFVLWLLNKNVIRPIKELMTVTEKVAEGDLTQTLKTPDGPQEIVALSRSFNTMMTSLQVSREERESHILSLEKTNYELLRTQQELVQAEKLASIGRLSAGMAHEIGNPLGAVVGYLGILQSELTDEGHRNIASCALSEAGRIDRLVREMLDYAAPAKGIIETFEPVAAVHESLRFLQSQGIFSQRFIDDQLPSELPKIQMQRYQFIQVIVNILINACDATPVDGKITINGRCDGCDLQLTIMDNGEGMTAEVMKQIFDPFFTTKPTSQGRGLGLAVCQRIISEVGGRIDVYASPSQGSHFTIHLRTCGENCDG